MWNDIGEYRKRPRNCWIFENKMAGNDSVGAFLRFCFNASAVSSFELIFVDLSSQLKN